MNIDMRMGRDEELNLDEIYKLDDMLTAAGIPHMIRDCWHGKQICYPVCIDEEGCVCDAILHEFSYGHEGGLLEIMGLVDENAVGDTVEGNLTAEEVFNRIKEHYDNSMGCA